jgi:hypothetical protein
MSVGELEDLGPALYGELFREAITDLLEPRATLRPVRTKPRPWYSQGRCHCLAVRVTFLIASGCVPGCYQLANAQGQVTSPMLCSLKSGACRATVQ